MTRIFITGSADGLGRLAARTLLDDGHEVILHARDTHRLTAVKDLVDAGAEAVAGDLSDPDQIRAVAAQVNRLTPPDAVIHNAGLYTGAAIMPVNVVAPYLLTALIAGPSRLVYLSSGMHRGGRADVTGVDWSGGRAGSYSDSKLFVTALAFAVARRRPEVLSNAVDPGWVPTRMGGPGAPDDLRLGHLTQEWLVTGDVSDTGGYWHHQRRQSPHPAAGDVDFQDRLLRALADFTGVPLT
ncbi:short-chain dehydrogenase [Actinoplanes italicus]|uniref:Short-subunit dehydrogenase n=1 Tax=Actinoplanes italicus TaxID=113567 RepID=A0A2T0K905_9ACTN|nr:SDR family NAD(P)-dependent oxidoreductase [Actinoplanes italicus]PRX19552.1 short-subunit dehydrogenase [Actinoplanes italicus]GIE30434.1 short-chain dehydrogenase [Actinoplanes italicus]